MTQTTMIAMIRPARAAGLVAIVAAILLLVAGSPPIPGEAADHLDAPGLTSPGGDAQADINDLYVFGGAEGMTTIAATYVPAAAADSSFGSDILYELKVDTDGDAVEDHSFEVTFSDVRSDGAQFAVLQHAEGADAADGSANGSLAAYGATNRAIEFGEGARLYAGLRSDPFFFDLGGFLGTVEGADNGRMLNDGNESDFFEPLDVLSIVIEVPDTMFGGPIGVWATTSDADGVQIDRMGRPAINTVVNSSGPVVSAPSENKNVYNAGEPKDDSLNFTGAVVAALQAYSSLDPVEGAYTNDQATALAGALLPDVITFDKTSTLPAPLNGRALADDVIDTELRIVTGGDPLGLFGGARDADGGVNTDGIGPHTDYLSTFPYLGEAQADVPAPGLSGTRFRSRLWGGSEVPPVDTPARGIANFGLIDDDLRYLVIANRLEDAVAAHIHLGDPDENGPVAALLFGSGPTDVRGRLSAGALGDGDLVAGSISDLIEVLQGGFGYVNVHTVNNPGGEIRGQIQPIQVRPGAFADSGGSVHEANIDAIATVGITLGCNPPDNDEFCGEDSLTREQMAAFLNRALNLPDGPDAFTDDEDSIFENDINALAAAGVTLGCNPPTNDQFCGTDPLTRGEMAAFAVRGLGVPSTGTDYFTDDEGSLFEPAINALAEAGVVVGCNPPDNDMYCPDRLITRAEQATFLARAFGWGT